MKICQRNMQNNSEKTDTPTEVRSWCLIANLAYISISDQSRKMEMYQNQTKATPAKI